MKRLIARALECVIYVAMNGSGTGSRPFWVIRAGNWLRYTTRDFIIAHGDGFGGGSR